MIHGLGGHIGLLSSCTGSEGVFLKGAGSPYTIYLNASILLTE